MAPLTKLGLICLGISVLLFLLEGIADRKGFGALVASMRNALLVMAVGMIAVGLVKG